jgi:hypothetical protein
MPVRAGLRSYYRSSLVALVSLACASEPDPEKPDEGAKGGTSALGGTAGTGGTGGTAARGGTGGASGSGGMLASSGTGGTNLNTGGTAGMLTTGGTGGGSSGAGGVAGAGGSAGTNAGAGAGGASGGTPSGGGAGLGGTAGMGGFSGAAAGASGAAGASAVASALDGLRVDDPCAGTPTLADGDTCNHVMLTQAGGFKASKEVMIAGTPGTTYDVTLRIRGVVEPTNISGGMRPNTTTFQYMNMAFRTEPLTIGGTVASDDADYAQWHIHIASPAQDLYLNDYQKVGHYIFELDYEVTVPMAANTQVTLDATDNNERQIVNYEEYAPDGIPGSMNYGQFIQINVVSVVPQAD